MVALHWPEGKAKYYIKYFKYKFDLIWIDGNEHIILEGIYRLFWREYIDIQLTFKIEVMFLFLVFVLL